MMRFAGDLGPNTSGERRPRRLSAWRAASAAIVAALVVPLVLTLVLTLLAPAATAADTPEPSIAVVTSQLAQTVTLLDAHTMKALGAVSVPGKPAGVAVTADGATAYVTAPEGPAVVRIDLASRTITRQATLGKGPLGIALNPKSGAVYVADWYGDVLFVLSPDLETIAEIAVGRSPSGVAVTPDGLTVVTADRDSNQLSVISTKTNAVIATIQTGARPFGVTLSADGRTAYTANVKDNTVSVRDLSAVLSGDSAQAAMAKAAQSAEVAVGRRPYAVALAGGMAFVTDQYDATVTVFDLATLAVIKTLDVGAYPEGIAASGGGDKVYVACWEDNALARIDVATLRVDATLEMPDGPRAFGNFLAP